MLSGNAGDEGRDIASACYVVAQPFVIPLKMSLKQRLAFLHLLNL
jgi:hypothetical protein